MAIQLELKVAEALPRDVGRGLARIDPRQMDEMGTGAGDVVLITGKKAAVVKVLPCYPEHRGKNLVQVDGITRRSLETGLDDRVTLARVEARRAQKVTLQAPQDLYASLQNSRARLGQALQGLPLLTGNWARLSLFYSSVYDLQVVATVPDGPVLVDGEVAVQLVAGASQQVRTKLSYEDIGGLGEEIRKVREMIELPLRYPELFQRLGIDAPKGVLLFGPPGTGKTLTARAVAQETDAYFVAINGPEIISKFYGESEAKLREVFAAASENAPAIVFIDEIDAIAPRREEVKGEVEKRVVSQLLTLMDGLEARGKVVVIGATNLPNSLDPALRRPGRFDREIAFGVPGKEGRLEILEIHTRNMPLAADADLRAIARLTHGFVGADMAALCREAAMVSLRDFLPHLDLNLQSIPEHLLEKIVVTGEHFLAALKKVEPASIREFFTELPETRWSDIGGLAAVKRQLVEAVEWPLRFEAVYQKLHVAPPRGILLFGPPGTGKTLLARACAAETGVNFIAVRGPELMSKWVGETERAVREVFKKARQAAPCIIFFDEFESLAPVRGGDTNQPAARVVSQLLAEIDGVNPGQGVLLLAATNRLEMLDPALLRPGRFDLILEVPLPDIEDRIAILQVHARHLPWRHEVDYQRLGGRTAGMSGAELAWLCQSAALEAIRNWVAGEGRGEPVVEAACLEQALALFTNKRAES